MTPTTLMTHPAALGALLLLLVLGTGAAALRLRARHRALAARLAASEHQTRDKQIELDTVVSSVGDGVVTINEASRIASFNQAAAAIFGHRAADVIGMPVTMLMPLDLRPQFETAMADYLRTGEARLIGKPHVEVTGLRKDGSEFALELTARETRVDKRRIIIGIVRDITQRKQSEEKLLFLAQFDILTGLPNRALLMDRLKGAVLRAIRTRDAMAVMCINVDGFRNINDTLGHHAGDVLLRQVAERLSQAVRKSDTVARLSGDEFTVILEALNYPIIDTRDVAEKILAAMRNPFDLGGHHVSITVSIGLALHASSDTDVDGLLRRAEEAMRRAKAGGKNRCCG